MSVQCIGRVGTRGYLIYTPLVGTIIGRANECVMKPVPTTRARPDDIAYGFIYQYCLCAYPETIKLMSYETAGNTGEYNLRSPCARVVVKAPKRQMTDPLCYGLS